MKLIFLHLWLLVVVNTNGCAGRAFHQGNQSIQNVPRTGGPCEGCEAIYESSVPFAHLPWLDTLPDFKNVGVKLKVSGIVYERDSRTPAKNVVLYIYHTNQQGKYPTRGNEEGWGKRHGYLRTWLKTNEQGAYEFYTLKPASYPQSSIPAHIHITIKEENTNEYWIDDFQFEDDPLLTIKKRAAQRNYGGSGILSLCKQGDLLVGERDIILGLNIPNYPDEVVKPLASGFPVSSNCPAFEPIHLWGIDTGTGACPMCKYGYGKGVMVWWSSNNAEVFIKKMKLLERELNLVDTSARLFGIYLAKDKGAFNTMRKEMQWKIEQAGITNTAILIIPPEVYEQAIADYQLNEHSNISSTTIVYKKRRVQASYINLEMNKHDVALLMRKLL